MEEQKQQEQDNPNSAKEVASKAIGKWGVPWIVLLVLAGIIASVYLESGALTAVVGLVSTVVMALISMLSGITGTKDKEEKPEFKIINELIAQVAKEEPVTVDVDGDRVIVRKGNSTMTTNKEK